MSLPDLSPMTEAEFEAAKHVTLDPMECLRCGRWLTSRASIVRGYGVTCALMQALEELSHGAGRNPKRLFAPIPMVEFTEAAPGRWEIADHRNIVIGELRQTKGGAWNITLWGHKVDLDADLESAKRRVGRIISRMGR